MPHFDPRSELDRQLLAEKLDATLGRAGFRMLPNLGGSEQVYAREVRGGVSIRIYSTIVRGARGLEVRTAGQDAIRASLIYVGPKGERGLARSVRVHRIGLVEDISERMLERARDLYRKVGTLTPCPCCGAPKFTAKSGKLVCANICWEKQ